MTTAPGEQPGAPGPVRMGDPEITASIAAAVHGPFAAVWRDHDEAGWRRIRRVMQQTVDAHAAALAAFEAGTEAVSGPGDGADAEAVLADYRRRSARSVLRPLHAVLRHNPLAVPLHRSLRAAANRAREAAAGLPELALAPLAPDALTRSAGLGAAADVKRLWARVLRPIVWRLENHEVAVSSLALRHLEGDVLPHQHRAFRDSQRGRAGWLGRVERASSAWTRTVLLPPKGRQAGDSRATSDEVRVCSAAARELQSELEGLRDGITGASGREAGEDFRRLAETLAAAVAVAGTLVAPTPRSVRHEDGGERLADRWDRWADEAAARLELCRGLLSMRTAADAIRQRLMDRWDETARAVDAVLDRIDAALKAGLARARQAPQDPNRLGRDLSAEQERTLRTLDQGAADLEDLASFVQAMTVRAEEAVEDLEAKCLQLPEVDVHDLPEFGETIRRPGTDTRAVPTREFAVQAFDTMRMERIRTAPSEVAKALERVRFEVLELCQVASYAFQAAAAELEEGEGGAPARVLVLVTDGLSRAADKAAAARGVLYEGMGAAGHRVRIEVRDGLEHLVRRVTADRFVGGYLDARTYLATEVAGDWKRLRGRALRGVLLISAALRTLGTRLRPVLKALGMRSAVQQTADPGENTLASAAEFVSTLPIVYQRLFAFEPVTDSRFLAGREDELDEVAARWTRWKAGGPGSLLVVAPPGAGITSLLNIAAGRLAREAPRGVRQTLRERFREEAALAARLASWLGLGKAENLGGLARALERSPAGSIPRLVILEGAEHLHLRAPGGGRLFRRFLEFVSRTESHLFWIVSLNTSAWQLLRTREPTLATDMPRLALEPLGPGELREAIASRHLRSGLPLQYVEPRTGTVALRTRAHRVHKGDRRQKLIEKDYFDRLHRASLGSVRLALFHWLHSADFTTAEGRLLVRPLKPLSPPTDLLDLTRCFALKAILDHGTLSAEEYCEVLRTSMAECAHTLRALQDDHFITGIADGNPQSSGGSGSGGRYRLRSLMTGAVIAHLRSRNILH